MQVNEHLLKISGKRRDLIVLTKPLQMDQEVILKVEGQVVKIEDETNNDGTVNRIYIIKGIIAD
jgi:hypothetical protein